MQQGQREKADRRQQVDGGSRESAGSPQLLRVRPGTVAGALGVSFACGAVPTGIALIAAEPDGVGAAIVVWAILSIAVALPFGLVVGLVGRRTERLLRARSAAHPVRWAPWGVGVAVIGHWAPLCLWTPLLVLRSIARPSRADELLVLAVVSLVAWMAVGAGVGLVLIASRVPAPVERRSPPRVAYQASTVPTSALLGAAAALVAALPSAAWVVWLDTAWSRGAGTAGLAAWTLLSAGGAVLAGWLTGVVCIGATAVDPRIGTGVRARQLEVVGAVLAGVWIAGFLHALSGPISGLVRGADDLRYTVLFGSLAAVTVGVALWSVGRTLRAAEVEARGASGRSPPDARPAPR